MDRRRPLRMNDVRVGEWAHVRYHKRQHLVVADRPDEGLAEPVLFACGRRTWRNAIWHDAPKPHLPRCLGCENA